MSDIDRQIDMSEAAVTAFREALAIKIPQCEQAAAEAAEDHDDGKPVMAKLSFALTWPAGAYPVKIDMKATHSVSRSLSFSAIADGSQGKLPLTA